MILQLFSHLIINFSSKNIFKFGYERKEDKKIMKVYNKNKRALEKKENI